MEADGRLKMLTTEKDANREATAKMNQKQSGQKSKMLFKELFLLRDEPDNKQVGRKTGNQNIIIKIDNKTQQFVREGPRH